MSITKITGNFRTKLIISIYKNWINNGDNILDIGCGTGIVAKIIGDYFTTKIIGCDVKNYLIYNIPFIKIKNNHIPLENNSFKVALLNDVLHHIDKKAQFDIIKEATRVADKVLIFEFEPTLVGKITDIILNKLHYGDLKAPLSVRTRDEWQKVFRNLGYQYKSVKVNRPFWYPFSHIAFILTKK